MAATLIAKAAIARGSAEGLLEAAGGAFVVKLWLDGVEVSGHGYEAQTVRALGSVQEVDGGTAAQIGAAEAVRFTADGGSIVYNELAVYDSTGRILLWASGSSAVTEIPDGESHDIMVAFKFPAEITPQLESVAERLAALEEWQEQELDLRSVTLDMRDFTSLARIDDDEWDNTPAIAEMFNQSYTEQRAEIFVPPGGTWHMLTAMNPNAGGVAAAQNKFNNITIRGLAPEWTVQHQEEEGDLDLDNTYFSRLQYHGAAGTIWWDQQRPYRFGALRLKNLTIRSDNQAGLFRLGDSTGSFLSAAYRGLYAEACYFPCNAHITAQWLVNSGADGYTLPTHLAYAFDILRGFDTTLINCGFRGWGGAAVRTMNTDRVLMSNCKSILCALIVDRKDASSVATVLSNCWAESAPYFGISTTGKTTDLDAEMGYKSVLTPDIGDYALPASVTWTIAQGGTYIQLANLPAGRTAASYFRENTFIRIEPDTVAQPLEATVGPRWFYIHTVTADRLYFSGAASNCYVQWALSGAGDKIFRAFNIMAILAGDQINMKGYSLRFNEDNAGRIYGIIPGRRELEISGHAELTGQLEGSLPSAYLPVVAASCAGHEGNHGGVACASRNQAPDHPLVSFDGGPPLDPNVRGPIFDEANNAQVFKPGRGVGSHSNNSRSLAFHRILDPNRGFPGVGQYVWLYRLSDHAAGWYLRTIREAGKAVAYTAWYHVPSGAGTPTLAISGGTGADNTHVLAEGFGKVSGTITAGQMATDEHGARLQLKNVAGVYIEKVVCTQ